MTGLSERGQAKAGQRRCESAWEMPPRSARQQQWTARSGGEGVGLCCKDSTIEVAAADPAGQSLDLASGADRNVRWARAARRVVRVSWGEKRRGVAESEVNNLRSRKVFLILEEGGPIQRADV